MEIKTFRELIDWTREEHGNLARCLDDCSAKHEDERARGLLEYLARHESEIEWMVKEFERQGDEKALETLLYDYLTSPPVRSHPFCDERYVKLDFDGICENVFDRHKKLVEVYEILARKALIPEAEELVTSLLEMEKGEARRLAQQVVLMKDV